MTLIAVSLTRFLGDEGLSTKDVLHPGHRFQMRRGAAPPISAFMIQVESFWDRADELLIRESMGQALLSVLREVTISVLLSNISQPDPAARVGFRFVLLLEAFKVSLLHLSFR